MSGESQLSPVERSVVARVQALADPEPTMSRGRSMLSIRRRTEALRAARRRRKVAIAAMGVLLVGGAAAAAPPVRSWIGARLGGRPAADTVADQQAAPRAIENARRLGSIVYFTPSADQVIVRFDAAQRRGWLTVATTPVALNGIAALGGSSAEIVVTPAALRIRNDSTSTMSYMLILSKAMRTVRLRIGSSERTVVVDTNQTQRIPLSW